MTIISPWFCRVIDVGGIQGVTAVDVLVSEHEICVLDAVVAGNVTETDDVGGFIDAADND